MSAESAAVQAISADYHINVALISAAVSAVVAIPTAAISVAKHISEGSLSRRTDKAIRRLLGSTWHARLESLQLVKSSASPFLAFNVIRHHVGGYSDDTLRQMLVKCGALRFLDPNNVEVWALTWRIPRHQRQTPWTIEIPVYIGPPSSSLFSDNQARR